MWEPTPDEIDAKLIELAYTWGDIEEGIEQAAVDGGDPEADFLSETIRKAFRVEVVYGENGWGDPCTYYVLLYDVADADARDAHRQLVERNSRLRRLIRDRAHPWHTHDFLIIRAVNRTAPIAGQLCRRLGQAHPPTVTPSLEDLPVQRPTDSAVELVEIDGYLLTPIEVPFYEALRETGLTFAVQPWIQGTDRRYRVDFLVLYDGRAIAIELDGHDWHKTKEQRARDAARDRWLAEREIQTLRWTGSEVYADPQGCVSELLNALRGASARP